MKFQPKPKNTVGYEYRLRMKGTTIGNTDVGNEGLIWFPPLGDSYVLLYNHSTVFGSPKINI